jgi:ArsR family transcriptional regulator, arsenate/arsenite/antimonite-responsive transcriptional repressor
VTAVRAVTAALQWFGISRTMEMSRAVAAFEALGQLSRLGVFRLLAQTGGATAGDIARQLAMKPNTLSGHLSILQAAGLLASTREGRSIRYSVDAAGLRALLTWLLQDCCGGSPELCAPVLNRIACACKDVT